MKEDDHAHDEHDHADEETVTVSWELTFDALDQATFEAIEDALKHVIAHDNGVMESDITLVLHTDENAVEAEIGVADDTAGDALVATLGAIELSDLQSDLAAEFTEEGITSAPTLTAVGTPAKEEAHTEETVTVSWELTFDALDQDKLTDIEDSLKHVISHDNGVLESDITLVLHEAENAVEVEIAVADDAAGDSLVATLSGITLEDLQSDLVGEFTENGVTEAPTLTEVGTPAVEGGDHGHDRVVRRLMKVKRRRLQGIPVEDTHDDHDHAAHQCIQVPAGGQVPVGTDASMITFDENAWITSVTFHYEGCAGIFTMPGISDTVRIGSTDGTILDFSGGSAAEDSSDDDDKKEWGQAIAANLLCLAPTLTALFFMGKIREVMDRNLSYILSFCLGVLLATAMMHVYPESINLLDWTEEFPDGHDAEVAVFWTSGSVFISGLMLFLGLRYLVAGHGHVHDTNHKTIRPDVSGEGVMGGDPDLHFMDVEKAMRKSRWNSVTLGILLGDGAHHFVDGIIIGAAFSDCSVSFAWTITFAILMHEGAHTLADICIILSQGFSVVETALLNIASGLVSLLGTVIILSLDISTNVQGLLLSFGASMFVAVGLVEILPEIESMATRARFPWLVLWFCVGCTIMGLLLLEHEHCEASGGHEGHNH